MPLLTLSDRDMSLQRPVPDRLQSNVLEMWALAQALCATALDVCARAAEMRHASAQRRQRAQELRTRSAQLCVMGIRQHQDGHTQD